MTQWCGSNELQEKFADHLRPASVVMDIGCGIRPQQLLVPESLICVEPHGEYADILRKQFAGTNTFIISQDGLTALNGFPDRSVDTIFLIDVIEHVVKDEGKDIIAACQRVARQQVVIFTPLGYMPQESHDSGRDGWNLHAGSWQDHKSGWLPDDFPGWKIIACRDLHTHDVRGEPITPPYGGFYAIWNAPKVENHFNSLYASEVMRHHTSSLGPLHQHYPGLLKAIVTHHQRRAMLKVAIDACQIMVLRLIEQPNAPLNEVYDEVLKRREGHLLNASRQFIASLHAFSTEFSGLNESIATQLKKLDAREAEISTKEAEINAKIARHDRRKLVRLWRKLRSLYALR